MNEQLEDPLYVETLVKMYPEETAELLRGMGYIIVEPKKDK